MASLFIHIINDNIGDKLLGNGMVIRISQMCLHILHIFMSIGGGDTLIRKLFNLIYTPPVSNPCHLSITCIHALKTIEIPIVYV